MTRHDLPDQSNHPPEKTATTAPPAPVPSRAEGAARTLGTAAAVVAVILFLNLGSLPVRLSLGQLVVVFLAISVALEAVQWARRGIRRQAQNKLAAMILEYGGGIYGTVAVATFAYLNAIDLYGDIVDAGSLAAFLGSISLGWLISEAIEAFIFGLKSMVWPWYWFSGHGFFAPWIVAGTVWCADALLKPLGRWLAARRTAAAEAAAGAEHA